MEKRVIGDIFIGNFPISQYFGQNRELYKRFGLAGHNGIDFAMPVNTPLIAGVDGKVIETGLDKEGYGLYVKIFDSGQKMNLIFAHMNISLVKLGQQVSKYSIIGLSGVTGFATGPHLHFGVSFTDESGKKLNPDNGFFGYIDPLNPKLISWDIRDPQGIYANHFAR